MKDIPLISVVIPVYNVEKYLRECIDSVLNQTYKNIEVILVDDGSTDSSGKICDSYQKLDSRVQVIHQKNQGLSGARNTGIDIMKGEYVTLIDSDDFVKNDYIRYLYDLIEKTGAMLSVCQPVLFRNDIENIRAGQIFDESFYVLDGSYNCMKDFLQNGNIGTVAWGKLYKRSLFNTIRYPEGKYHEDVFTTYLLIDACQSIVVGNQEKYCYRQRQGSILHSSFSKKHLDIIEGKIEIYKYIEGKYPNLKTSAEQGIIYGANQCVLRIMGQGKVEKNISQYLQALYKKHIISFLIGHSTILSKIFACVCYININIILICGSKLFFIKKV